MLLLIRGFLNGTEICSKVIHECSEVAHSNCVTGLQKICRFFVKCQSCELIRGYGRNFLNRENFC